MLLSQPAGFRKLKFGAELAKFQAALDQAEANLLSLQRDVSKKIGKQEAEIFRAQVLMLRDPVFLNDVSARCTTERINVEAALAEVIDRFAHIVSDFKDSYLRERASDIRDVGRRVLDLLLRQRAEGSITFPEGSIIVAAELFPSTTAHIDMHTVCGAIIERGGKTSHASILLRSLGIPAVVGVEDATHCVKSGDGIVLDALSGTIFINPREEVLREYERLRSDLDARRDALKELIDLPAVTRDGVSVPLYANIAKTADAEAASFLKADGVGLFRTEFGFSIRDHFPTEDEQYAIYLAVAERLKPRVVVIRTLEIGSDKTLPYFPRPLEDNPSLGCRGTRLLLRHVEIFKTQLRAILRVSASHNVAALFPMIGGVEDVIKVKQIVKSATADLQHKHQPFNSRLPLGVMVEVPSAAIAARRIAREVDFLSIGTNDLVQYLLAADRASQEAASYYEPLHPAVLHTIKSVVDAGRSESKDVAICGEMAGDPFCTALLVGLGLRQFSVVPSELLEVKNVLRSITLRDAEELARRAPKRDDRRSEGGMSAFPGKLC